MTIDKDVYDTFKEFCRQNGMKVSTKVELLMRDSAKNVSLKKFIE
ncbi:MAG: hypothetical protein U9O94_05025 [Nanoarchaeota archaeon]|nr:hypothetical protein [Nanoarchaeota archaeon]